MKRFIVILFLSLFLINLISCQSFLNNDNTSFKFIASADMRFYTVEPYYGQKHFLGAIKAIKKAGAGSFMISPGDFDPPAAAYKLIVENLGENYPWYPAMGNHELESPDYVEWLREYNKNGATLPNIVRKGPIGCEETTYSFDWGNCHFVALNQYFDGTSDIGTDGDVVPKLLDWLEQDLSATKKRFIFVLGHEPIVSIPDMDNGRIRHQGDSLDKYPKNSFRFYQIMMKHKVTAYVCGHTHSTSYANISGLWQLDVGHARGIEENAAPEILFPMTFTFIKAAEEKGLSFDEAIKQYFEENKKQIKKTIFDLHWTNVEEYKKIADEEAFLKFVRFYQQYQDPQTRSIIEKTFWENCSYRKSSFMKFYVKKNSVKVEIYRDDAHGGNYTLRETVLLK